MRKLYTLILWFTVACAFAWEGAGTKVNPFKIASAQDLVNLSTSITSSNRYADTYFLMTGDIDMSNVSFTPIGRMYAFEGNFDGGNFAIKNLKVVDTRSDYVVGLFAGVSNGSIENLTVSNSYFEGYRHVAAIVASARDTKILNCHNRSTVKGASDYVAGIAGEFRGSTIELCSNAGYIVSEGENIGGIAGSIIGGAMVKGCHNSGTVKGKTYVGGVLGTVNSSEWLTDSYNTGVVIGTREYVGGVVGKVNTGLVNNGNMSTCYNSGKVQGNNYVGGVAGHAVAMSNSCNVGEVIAPTSGESSGLNVGGVAGGGSVFNSYNLAQVTGNKNVGGVIGNVTEALNSYNLGSVSGKTDVGGIAGRMGGDACAMANCYSAGSVSASDATPLVGGIVGSINLSGFIVTNNIKNCYWDTDVYAGKATSTDVGTDPDFVMIGKNTSYMKGSLAAVLGSAFQNKTNAYPVLIGNVATLEPGNPTACYTVTTSTSDDGAILFTGAVEFAAGSSLVFVATPNKDFGVASFKVDGANQGHVTSYTFDNISTDHSIDIAFASASNVSNQTIGYAIYPRITKDKFFIKGAAGNSFMAFDLTGKPVNSRMLSSDAETIEMAGWSKGIYLIRLEKGNVVATYKIVKQ